MENKIVAGLVAGIPLSVVMVVYMLVRGRALVRLIMSDGDTGGMSEQQWHIIFLVTLALMPLGFGALAGWIYSLVGSGQTFLYIGLGAATLFSILALISRTPMALDKIVLNFAVGGLLGWLVPLLSK